MLDCYFVQIIATTISQASYHASQYAKFIVKIEL